MGRIRQIVLVVATLSILVITFSAVASWVLKPNQATPIMNVLPAQTSNVDFPDGYTIAAWVWTYPTELKDKVDPMINFASREKINTLYLYIDEYIDIYEMPDSEEKTTKMNEYLNALIDFLTKAKDKGIKVEALSGNPAYSYDSHSYIPPIIMKHVYEFNRENPNSPFSGIQFDIEFYDDKRFFGSTEEYTGDYVTLVSDLAKLSKELNTEYQQNLRLGFVIPFWFDKPNDYFVKPILPDIIKNLSILKNPYLIVMAYRNVIDGDGSVLEVSKDELEQTKDTPVKIIIAQELVKNKDQKITHYGESKDQIKTDFDKIIELAKSSSCFEGVSIHDLSAFMNTR